MSLPRFAVASSWPLGQETRCDSGHPAVGAGKQCFVRSVSGPLTLGDTMSDVDCRAPDKHCLEGTTVLVVEDEVRFSRILQRYLKLSGVSPIEAVDGGQAIRILEQDDGDRVDAVLTDLKMPVVSGWELIAVLRECRPHLPVVAMSATDPPPALLGDVPLLNKPFLPEQLLETLAPLVRRSRKLREQSRQQRADAAGVRSEARYQTFMARQERCRTGDMMATLLGYRASQRQRL
jgi:CheY-like chemotaxis protein